MKKHTMFLRMITASLIRRRSRMLVALLAITVGATILSGLVLIYYDVPRQMGAQFRNYGANMILTPADSNSVFNREAIDDAVGRIEKSKVVGVTPYHYDSVRINEIPMIVAGTDMEGAQSTSPYWDVDGSWPSKDGEIMFGEEAADSMGMVIGDKVTLKYLPAAEEEAAAAAEAAAGGSAGAIDPSTALEDNSVSMEFTISGILDTGGTEEEYVYISIDDMEKLIGTDFTLDLAELSISATQEELEKYEKQIKDNCPDVTPKLVKRVTQSETTVLSKLQALVFLVTVIVLLLTMICVTTTMMASATERRKEIGLRKALGASDGSIVMEFMGEGLLLGGIAGLVGSILGFAFAQAVSMNVFNSSIAFRPLIIPVTMIVSILVTGLACLLPVRSATDVDPAIVLKGE